RQHFFCIAVCARPPQISVWTSVVIAQRIANVAGFAQTLFKIQPAKTPLIFGCLRRGAAHRFRPPRNPVALSRLTRSRRQHLRQAFSSSIACLWPEHTRPASGLLLNERVENQIYRVALRRSLLWLRPSNHGEE